MSSAVVCVWRRAAAMSPVVECVVRGRVGGVVRSGSRPAAFSTTPPLPTDAISTSTTHSLHFARIRVAHSQSASQRRALVGMDGAVLRGPLLRVSSQPRLFATVHRAVGRAAYTTVTGVTGVNGDQKSAPSSPVRRGKDGRSIAPSPASGGDPSKKPKGPKFSRHDKITMFLSLTGLFGSVGLIMYVLEQQSVQALEELSASQINLTTDDTENPLAPSKLPPLVAPHHVWSRWQRMCFYVRLVWRGLMLGAVWVPVLGLGLVLSRRLWLRLVIRALESSGPLFIKLGQWAATRPDLFPRDACEALTHLHRVAPLHSFEASLDACRRAFGDKLIQGDSRLVLEPRVLGSGSMAQVHSGYLEKSDGSKREVAIKILHPRIHSRMGLDLTLLYYAARAVMCLPQYQAEVQWLSVPEMILHFTRSVGSQLDLGHEAGNMVAFRKNFEDEPSVTFPTPLYPFISTEVMVQSLAHGVLLSAVMNPANEAVVPKSKSTAESDATTSASAHIDLARARVTPMRSELARITLHAYLHMLLVDGLVHGDLHPGNILVQFSTHGQLQRDVEDVREMEFFYDRLTNPKTHLCILDSGLVADLTYDQQQRTKLLDVIAALVLRDGRQVARHLLYGTTKHSCTDPAALESSMQQVVSTLPLESCGRIDLTRALVDVLDCARQHRVKLDGEFVSLAISLGVVEGIARQLDPDRSLVHESLATMLTTHDARRSLLLSFGSEGALELWRRKNRYEKEMETRVEAMREATATTTTTTVAA